MIISSYFKPYYNVQTNEYYWIKMIILNHIVISMR